jgi:endonuclease-3
MQALARQVLNGVTGIPMATTVNKQRLLTHLLQAAKKAIEAEPEARPVLEQFLYALCRENTTREQADAAYRNLQERFFDWNEVRVSSVRELEEALAGLPGAEARAQRIILFLQEVFETTFSFDLTGLEKKGLKQAAKQLGRYQAANDYSCAWVIQRSLGGHAIPLDAPTLRCARRLGLLEPGQEGTEAARASLEHLVPKAKGPQFTDAISHVADTFCWEEDPHCTACPLASECPTAQETTAALTPVRAHRPKPR